MVRHDTTTLGTREPVGAVNALEGLPLLGERYRVLGMIGGGGMGNVYLAHDTELDENVAVKLLKASLSKSAEQVDLLRREVKFARRVTHPNVLRTFDIGDHEGAKFLTMEHVDGTTLNDLLPRKLPLAEVMRIAHAVCAGLGAAHDAGVIHRDLKPSNVLLGRDGRILLSDFGIACLADDPVAGVLAGTPGYMAPELFSDEPVDARADVWALGALVYEMLTGERAFRYRSREDLLRPLLETAPDPTEHRPEVPLALARVVTRCMARVPSARFSHPQEVSAAIAAAVPMPASSKTGSLPRVPVTTVRRARVLAVLPLSNLGPPESAHLAEGLTAVLINGMSSRELRVPSRAAVETAGHAGRDPLQVGRDLGAEAIVTGSVGVTASGGLLIELRVIGTGDGLVLYSERVECGLTDVVGAAEAASRSIARALLVDRKDALSAMHDGEVVDLYLQGLQESKGRWQQSADRSAVFFRQALERAPDDPMVLSALALALTRRLSFDGGEDVIAEARAISGRALSLARDRAEPHVAVAAVELQLMDSAAAARVLRVALAIAPHNADAHKMLGLLASETISATEGLAHLYTAITLDPTLAYARWWIARMHGLLGEWARCDAVFATPPDDPQEIDEYWVSRARTVVYARDPERREHFESELVAALPFASKAAITGALAVARGEQPWGDGLAMFLKEPGSPRRKCFSATIMAEVLCAGGNHESAMASLADADRAQSPDIVWLDNCSLLEPLRKRTDFIAIRKRVAARASLAAEVLASGSR
jgi:eukaryotic-like serine/threonine-protein kinase